MHLGDGTLRRLGWALVAVFVVFAVLGLVSSWQDSQEFSDWGASGRFGDFAFLAMTALFPIVAQLIVRQQPRNRIGWLLHAIGFCWAVSNLANFYVVMSLVVRPGSLPRGDIAEVINGATWAPPIMLMGAFVLLLFPDGHPPTQRWRVLAWVAGVDTVVVVLSIVFVPGRVEDVRIPLARNPIGISWAGPVPEILQLVSLLLLPLSILAAAAAMIRRFRRASGVDRVQLKWLMTAGVAIAAVFAFTLATSFFYDGGGPAPGWVIGMESFSILSFGLLPIAIGIAIMRHRLYGIDALISRTLTVGVLGAFITAVYVGIVVGVGTLIGQHRPSVWLSVLATALVAVAFQPVRARVQRLVNRLVYGDRATPYEVLSDFAVQMAGRYTPRELMPRLAQTLTECLGGGRVEIWLRTGRGLACEGAWPADDTRPRFLPSSENALSPLTALDGDHVVQVRHRGELLGGIAVTKHAHEPPTPAEQAMLEQVASQTGLVLRNLRLVEDLQNSRQRLVTSQDNERRRLERDLHDGAQQSLVSVAILLQVAAAQTDPAAQAASLVTATKQLRTAIDELRELAHGIHPAILTERGLGPAISSLATRCPVPVRLDSDLERRLPAPVEGTLYFVVAEALTNVAKYAQARHVDVTVREEEHAVEIAVADDGIGGAALGAGTGLIGLADRLAVVDGQLSIVSPPGEGTRLTCRVPLATEPLRPRSEVADDRPRHTDSRPPPRPTGLGGSRRRSPDFGDRRTTTSMDT